MKKNKPEKNIKLIAACGTYCGACEMYRAFRDDDQEKLNKTMEGFERMGMKIPISAIECDGCLAKGKITPWCSQCAMKKCPKHKDDNGICSPKCEDFPCEILKAFSTDNMTHHHEVIDSLRHCHEVGLEQHAAWEAERWSCTQCGQPLAWYSRKCPMCGAPRPEGLFEVEWDWSPDRYGKK